MQVVLMQVVVHIILGQMRILNWPECLVIHPENITFLDNNFVMVDFGLEIFLKVRNLDFVVLTEVFESAVRLYCEIMVVKILSRTRFSRLRESHILQHDTLGPRNVAGFWANVFQF